KQHAVSFSSISGSGNPNLIPIKPKSPAGNASTVADVVHLDSDSDDDHDRGGGGSFRSSASLTENRQAPSTTFLHSNATSHKWSFGAIAELLDNAVDEIQNGATFVKIDKIYIYKDNSPALVFQDDGGGMDPDGIRKCMSLGYSTKKSNTTIGQYGNGFKTSTMRLGADAIVFSRSTRGGKSTQSIGLLSYTFLRRTGQDDVIVPMIDMDISKERVQRIIYGSSEDWSTNLEILLKWSPFSTADELLQQFENIGTHGTKVIIYNLWLNDEGIYELSFDDDDEDIQLRDDNAPDGKKMLSKTLELRSHISYRYRHSLRAYASMLYLKKFKNFKIILRGIPVEQYNIADEFRHPQTVIYKPQAAEMEYAPTEIKVGFIKEAPKLPVCGFNVYHKNRLIQAAFPGCHWERSSIKRPWCCRYNLEERLMNQKSVPPGVLEANFIEPAHDKQDFERSSLFQRLEARLRKIVSDYWNRNCHVFGYRYSQMPADRSKRVAIPDEPPTVSTFSPSPLPPNNVTHGGPVIREISHSNGTSVRTFAVPPPHMRHSTGLRSNFQPVQLNPQPAATDTRSNLAGKSANEISAENIQLFMRCEEYIEKETEMEQTVRSLELELEEFKSKCAQLALLVDAKKKEMQQLVSMSSSETPSNAKIPVTDIVSLDTDSDDDDGGGGRGVSRSLSSLIENTQVTSTIAGAAAGPVETLECRSFWKAGESFVIPNVVTPAASGTLEHARVHPKFLHSNATSHQWAFGAIAELLDNAVDEIQNGATFVKIDKIDIAKDHSPALVFQDDGGGMDPNGMRKCMSLGYSTKKSNTTIGQYGNGFKTSTMRLGADAIVFSRSNRSGKPTQSVGLLSYTFLRRTGQDDVIVPMIDMDISKERPQPIIYGSLEDWSTNLEILLKWSPFSAEADLMQQFEDIGTHGTKVIIYNLWLNDEGIYELSFDDDDVDIRLRDEGLHDGKRLHHKELELRSHISYQLRYSLRAYASMLYLEKFKNFKIILRGIPVEQFNIADEFRYPEIIMYKPHTGTMEQATTEIRVGFIKEAPNFAVYGFNVYHKNRLIRPFWKVTMDGSSIGYGVVGVLEANFIEPSHNKQDFERSSLFQRLEARLKKVFTDYWSLLPLQNLFSNHLSVSFQYDFGSKPQYLCLTITQLLVMEKNRYGHCHVFGYSSYQIPADKSKRIAIPDQAPTVNTLNPLPLPSDKVSQGGPIIREISFSNGTSSRTVAVAPPHMRNSTGLRSNFQPVLLNHSPAVTDTGNNLVAKSVEEIKEANLQLFLKCEEFMKKETEMEQTVRSLGKELEEAKSKCAELSLLVDAKKKEMQQV
ncbi:unnamed protein product, partial [Thlaspi arvense]